jgi:hypothetical protein
LPATSCGVTVLTQAKANSEYLKQLAEYGHLYDDAAESESDGGGAGDATWRAAILAEDKVAQREAAERMAALSFTDKYRKAIVTMGVAADETATLETGHEAGNR